MVSKYTFAYWLFHAITFEWKVFSKIHESKIEQSLKDCRMYLTWSVERNDVDTRGVTDRQTNHRYSGTGISWLSGNEALS